MPSLVDIGLVVPDKKILKCLQCSLATLLLLPLGKGIGFSIEHVKIPFTKGYFALSLDEISPVVLEKILKYCTIHSLIHYYLPLKKGVAHHLLCAKFG